MSKDNKCVSAIIITYSVLFYLYCYVLSLYNNVFTWHLLPTVFVLAVVLMLVGRIVQGKLEDYYDD